MLFDPGSQGALIAAARATVSEAVDQEELDRPTLDQRGELCRR